MIKLPGLYALRTDDNSLNIWAQSVNEHLEVWKGSRGDATERVASQADIASLTAKVDAIKTESVNVDTLAAQLATNKVLLNAFTSTSPASTSTSSASEVASIKASIDDLSRRINALAGASSYGAAFTYVNPAGEVPGYWQIDKTIRIGDVSLIDVMQVLFDVFYDPYNAIQLAESLNGNLPIRGTGYSLLTLTQKVDELSNRVLALGG